LTTGLTTGYIV